MTLAHEMSRIGARAKEASRQMAKASPGAKALFLHRLAALLEQEQESLLAANARDLDAADARGIDAPRRDRLRLTPAVIAEMARACRHVADLDDPVGATESQWQRPNGLLVGRMRVPLGVVAMIYEARPNVTIDAAILCLKAGNAVILRGGSEALQSNMALAALLSRALDEARLPADAAQLVTSTDHGAVTELCRLDQFIDVMIPRGGESLVRAVQEAATMPVLKHYKGVCHAFVEESADLDQALDIIFNAKVQRPGVCNALECLLVQASVAGDFLPRVAERLGAAGVRFQACPRALPLLGAAARPATDEDWGMEYHALILAVRVVDSLEEAIAHIARYTTHHSEAIITEDAQAAETFMRRIDAAAVYHNASTRFTDGEEFGLGAEIGISTQKMHARGPMGLREICSYKYFVRGEGQVRG